MHFLCWSNCVTNKELYFLLLKYSSFGEDLNLIDDCSLMIANVVCFSLTVHFMDHEDVTYHENS